MAGWIMTLACIAMVVGFYAIGRRERQAQIEALSARFAREFGQKEGNAPQESQAHTCQYYLRNTEDGDIDDITWQDLEMDKVFNRINRCRSHLGEAYLYAQLRKPHRALGEAGEQSALADFFAGEGRQDWRQHFSLAFYDLGGMGKYSFWEGLELMALLPKPRRLRHMAAPALLAAAMGLAIFRPGAGIVALFLVFLYNIVTYFREKKEISGYLTTLAYSIRMTRILQDLQKKCGSSPEFAQGPWAGHWEEAGEISRRLSSLSRGSDILFSGAVPGTKGNPLDIFLDYVRMGLHLDLIIFDHMMAKAQQERHSLERCALLLGRMDAALSVASFRASLGGDWCKPQWQEAAMEAGQAYHLLLEAPVKNTFALDQGMILTGANASGKSTFLRTAGLLALLGQTIYTCPAAWYKAPVYGIYSSISLRDNMAQGESYYMVEIRSLKRIWQAAGHGPLLCILDEALRGTNTVERIAASAQLLLHMQGLGIHLLAATHDRELARLLEAYLGQWHFREELERKDVRFTYVLTPGITEQNNAIRLLERMDFPAEAVRAARDMAARFEAEGVWKLSD